MPKIFLSYRRGDDPYATHFVRDRLATHFGNESIFMDIDDIPFGVDFVEHLDREVSQCDIVLAMIGDRWLDLLTQNQHAGQADFVVIEIESALQRGIPVVPVLLGQAGMPAAKQLPDVLQRLARRNAAEVRPGRDFHDHVNRLIRGIEYLLGNVVDAKRPPATFSNALGMKFVFVPKGTFWMSENGKNAQQQVTIEQDFYMGVYPVTQGQWQAIMGNNPSYFSRNGVGKDKVKDISDEELQHFPIECVSRHDVQEFIEKLNKKEGSEWLYRLPTEAEWEYTCRGGAVSQEDCSFDYYFQSGPTNSLFSHQANFDGHIGRTTKVGEYEPNALGVYDMHGSVWEWTATEEASSHILRGGSWIYPAEGVRVANRFWYEPEGRGNFMGFRLASVQG